MRTFSAWIACWLLMVGSLSAYAQSDALSDRENAVLTAFCLRQMNRLDLPCMMADSTWTDALGESVLARIGRTSSLARDFRRKNRTRVWLDAERVVRAIPYSEDSGFPFKGAQRFSRVGFSARGDSALVQVLTWGRKTSYVMVRRRGDWAVAHTFQAGLGYGQ